MDGERRLTEHPPTLVRREDVTQPLADSALAAYRATLQEDRRMLLDRYAMADYALKVVGVGSVGLGAFIALLMGGTEDDPLFLQLKQAEASVYERYLGPEPRGEPRRARRRRAAPPAGRERHPARLDRRGVGAPLVRPAAPGPEGERRRRDDDGGDLLTWGELCAWALARGHARSGQPATISAYLGTDDVFELAMATFAEAYADQTERDHAALTAAIGTGRIKAESGV